VRVLALPAVPRQPGLCPGGARALDGGLPLPRIPPLGNRPPDWFGRPGNPGDSQPARLDDDHACPGRPAPDGSLARLVGSPRQPGPASASAVRSRVQAEAEHSDAPVPLVLARRDPGRAHRGLTAAAAVGAEADPGGGRLAGGGGAMDRGSWHRGAVLRRARLWLLSPLETRRAGPQLRRYPRLLFPAGAPGGQPLPTAADPRLAAAAR